MRFKMKKPTKSEKAVLDEAFKDLSLSTEEKAAIKLFLLSDNEHLVNARSLITNTLEKVRFCSGSNRFMIEEFEDFTRITDNYGQWSVDHSGSFSYNPDVKLT